MSASVCRDGARTFSKSTLGMLPGSSVLISGYTNSWPLLSSSSMRLLDGVNGRRRHGRELTLRFSRHGYLLKSSAHATLLTLFRTYVAKVQGAASPAPTHCHPDLASHAWVPALSGEGFECGGAIEVERHFPLMSYPDGSMSPRTPDSLQTAFGGRLSSKRGPRGI